jgi:UDP-glucose 4-epimerase
VKSLITGGSGFIGSHLIDLLLSKGEEVIVLDNFSGSSNQNLALRENHGSIRIVNGSITNLDLIENLMKLVDRCYHLAAIVGVERIVNYPFESLDTNIRGTEIILKTASKLKVRTLLASSSEIYGKNPKMPLSEDSDRILGSTKIPRWTYSEAKAIDEFYAFELNSKSGLQVSIARLFNTVGPRQSGEYGMVLPRFIKSALRNQPIVVYGDGSQTRSFCAVSDVVAALSRLIESTDTIGQAYNIGSTNEISINELAQKVIGITGSKSKIVFRNLNEVFGYNFEEPLRRVPDISKVSTTIGWSPKKSLDEIISEIANSLKTDAN